MKNKFIITSFVFLIIGTFTFIIYHQNKSTSVKKQEKEDFIVENHEKNKTDINLEEVNIVMETTVSLTFADDFSDYKLVKASCGFEAIIQVESIEHTNFSEFKKQIVKPFRKITGTVISNVDGSNKDLDLNKEIRFDMSGSITTIQDYVNSLIALDNRYISVFDQIPKDEWSTSYIRESPENSIDIQIGDQIYVCFDKTEDFLLASSGQYFTRHIDMDKKLWLNNYTNEWEAIPFKLKRDQ